MKKTKVFPLLLAAMVFAAGALASAKSHSTHSIIKAPGECQCAQPMDGGDYV